MSIKVMIESALSSLKVPVSDQYFENPPDTFVTYFIYDYGEEASADNNSVEDGYYIQVDIWSRSSEDADQVCAEVLSGMKTAGFNDPHYQELYERDTEIYHIPCRFFYAQNLE